MGRVLLALTLAAVSCAAPRRELERVAKDWCLTVRASQVLPVYPPSEDVEPGDVFLVETSLADQARIYEDKGFLALDQLVTRLRGLPYGTFYADGYFRNAYGSAPHERPGPGDATFPAPRVAFPAYSFRVDRSSGLELALPLSGVPLGLGILGATSAQGSVTMRDAFTYGVDGESLARALYAWWEGDDERRLAFGAIARDTGRPVYLRVVTRVFLARGVTVSLVNLDALAAGAAPALELLELAVEQPDAASAYREALGALGGGPGGSVRVVQASARAVTMDESFDRPLVIGYLGFDVRVFEDGRLSAPVPSFATLAEGSQALEEVRPLAFGEDGNTRLLQAFLDGEGNRDRLVEWLATRGLEIDPSDLLYGAEHEAARAEAVDHFGLR